MRRRLERALRVTRQSLVLVLVAHLLGVRVAGRGIDLAGLGLPDLGAGLVLGLGGLAAGVGCGHDVYFVCIDCDCFRFWSEGWKGIS